MWFRCMARYSMCDRQVTGMEFPKIPRVQDCEEWTYTMRRTMQEIVPGLFLGPYSAAMKSKLDHLKHHGVTHIVCVRQDIEAHFIRPNFPERFKYLVLDIADNVTENIIQHFPKVRQFVDESLSMGGKTLIHGNAGISRSAALALAYIMEKYGLSCKDAFSMVQQRRFCINPNEGFMAQLTEFEPIYKAQRTLQNGQCSTEKGRNKRRIDQVDDQVSNQAEIFMSEVMDMTGS
ncbi:serine/threonine/tyrosine-interacting protein-like isoform X2 [Zootermopsis nevadensis]|uniref:serine/threonine/tyrosine-interacting protein-like isoform X2 n=1 Tax=Zootermopsis nevadensis TaxID=136037 RepID=UPI000B8E669D|nr:serine/threonine/tyrosine-interacting protein-like isoform X2 [Zootermopsis nevadensis]